MKFITFLLCILTFEAFAQKSKEITVAKVQKAYIMGYIHFDNDNIPTDTSFYMRGQDFRYEYITEYITLAEGDLLQIRSVLQKCLEMFAEDPGTNFQFNDSYISVNKLLGMKMVFLYGIEDDSDGYHTFGKSQLIKAINQIDDFRKKN